MGCDWGEANHTYFQIANLFLAFTYLIPSTIKGLIMLRLCLGTAGFFFTMWGGFILCSPDTLGWNFAFMVINFVHVAYLLYNMRPIKFSEEHEVLYASIFENLHVARWQYKSMATIGVAHEFEQNKVIAVEMETTGDSISILTSGSVRVMKNDKLIHRIKACEFLDSPEWVVSTKTGGSILFTYQVSLISEGCNAITWKRSALLRVLRTHCYLKSIFDSIIGQDIAKKLFDSNNNNILWKNDQRKTSSNNEFLHPTYQLRGNVDDNQNKSSIPNFYELNPDYEGLIPNV